MGAAGDMLAAALLELVPDRASFVSMFNAIGIPGVAMMAETSSKCGIIGTHVRMMINGEEESAGDAPHDHEHHHEHHHSHHGLAEITEMVNGFRLNSTVKEDILNVYGLLAEAESKVHGTEISEIHFHEVGSMDAVADITAVCVLMRSIAPDAVYCSPVNTGSGRVRCAHGILPVPAPATAELLHGIPAYQGSIESELTTPTGAALLKYWVDEFGKMPCMSAEATGYGMGSKDFEIANCVRATVGTVSVQETGSDNGKASKMTVLECNLDDMTAEEMSYALDKLFGAGAVDAWLTPIVMKKSRLATKMSALCHEEDLDAVRTAIFRHTTTLGVRATEVTRYELERELETAECDCGTARVKKAKGYGVEKSKTEFDDAAAIADAFGMTIREVRECFEKASKNR